MSGAWVSVNERLPEVGRKVRFIASWNEGYLNEYFGSRDGDGMWDTETLALPKSDVIQWFDQGTEEE